MATDYARSLALATFRARMGPFDTELEHALTACLHQCTAAANKGESRTTFSYKNTVLSEARFTTLFEYIQYEMIARKLTVVYSNSNLSKRSFDIEVVWLH